MAANVEKVEARRKRSRRVRAKIRGTAQRPRLTVFRSNRNIFAQIVDDGSGATLVSASTLDKGFRKKPKESFTKETARGVGLRIAELAKEKKIAQVVFDRGPYLYHGKIKALGDAAREGGLEF